MKTVLLAAGALAVTLSAGQALANTHHKHKGGAASIAGPKQPIPYAELDSYLKASPAQRAKKDWWAGESVASNGAATTSTGANASATTPAPSPSAETTPSPPSTTEATPGASSANTAPPSTSGSALTPPSTTSQPGDTQSPPPK
jgi:hypothetical protein